MTATITLTEQELAVLSQIAQQTGKTEEELLRNALTHYLSHLHPACRRRVLHEARGMWHDSERSAEPHDPSGRIRPLR